MHCDSIHIITLSKSPAIPTGLLFLPLVPSCLVFLLLMYKFMTCSKDILPTLPSHIWVPFVSFYCLIYASEYSLWCWTRASADILTSSLILGGRRPAPHPTVALWVSWGCCHSTLLVDCLCGFHSHFISFCSPHTQEELLVSPPFQGTTGNFLVTQLGSEWVHPVCRV